MNHLLDYEQHLYGRGLAARTIRIYVGYLRRLDRYAATVGHTPETLPTHLVRRWADALPFTSSVRRQARYALKHHARMVGRRDEPWLAVRLPAKPRTRPRPITSGEAATLRDAAIMVGSRKGLATLCLLYTGARAGEVAGWRWDGIDLQGRTITWERDKSKDVHRMPVASDVLVAALARNAGEGYVFQGNNGRPHVTGTTVWNWVRQVAQMAGVDQVHPKRLRATVAHEVLRATGDIEAVARILGHRSIDTTYAYYLSADEDRMRSAIGALDY